jgi:hypothetical protein
VTDLVLIYESVTSSRNDFSLVTELPANSSMNELFFSAWPRYPWDTLVECSLTQKCILYWVGL